MKAILQTSQVTTSVKPTNLLPPIVALLFLFGLASSLQADTLTFQEGVNGYAGTQDTEIHEDDASTTLDEPNFPGGTSGGPNGSPITIDFEDSTNPDGADSYMLLRFDNIFGNGPNQIPLGTNIITARLRVFTVNEGDAGAHVQRMLFDWNEATATWNSMTNGGNGTPGAQADGSDADMTDHDADGLPGVVFPNITGAAAANTFTEADVTADVQAWANGTPNYGWVLIPNGNNGWDIPSSEGAVVAQRPRLFVEFGVQDPPEFTLQPTNFTVLQARTARFTVAADGSLPITYQWYKDGTTLIDPAINPSAATTTLVIANAQAGDAGLYHCNASNSIGNTNSESAMLTVEPDVVPPVALGATGSPLGIYVSIQFNEIMDAESLDDDFSYAVTRMDINQSIGVTAVRGSDGASAILTLNALEIVDIPPNTPMLVEMNNLWDVSTNIMPATNFVFNTFVPGCSTVLLDMFNTGPGNAINLLLNHPTFINNTPYYSTNVNTADSDPGLPTPDTRTAFPTREAYGGRIRGIWIPPYTGDWVLYLRSDDAGELYLNPNGTDPAGKMRVAEQLGCCNTLGDAAISSAAMNLPLVGGTPYYIEAVYKEGTGGDYVQIGAGLRGAGGITPISQAELGQSAPAGSGGEVTINQAPASQTVTAGTPVTFTARAASSLPGIPVCYQWQRDDADILGANGSIYGLTPSLADNGARFRVRVSVMGGATLTSTEATLTVFEDVTPPHVTSVTTDTARTNITVIFSEPMDPTTAVVTGNYSVAGITIQSATLANATTVNLAVNPALSRCQAYTLAISGVRDANTLTIGPTNIAFTGALLILDWDPTTMWSYQDDGLEPVGPWTERTYDDSTWLSGAALLGFETTAVVTEAPLRTTISNATRTATAYFRAHFNLDTDPSTVTSLKIRQIVDDGAIYYVNGTEVYRSRVDPGPVTHATLANAGGPEPTGGTHPTEGPFEALTTSSLRYGDNVLAVSLRATSGSSDSLFGATLSVDVTQCVTPLLLSITRENGSVSITANGAGTIYKASTPDAPPASWTLVGPAPQSVLADQQQQFFMIRP